VSSVLGRADVEGVESDEPDPLVYQHFFAARDALELAAAAVIWWPCTTFGQELAMKRFFASIALAALAFSAWALPSVDNVQAEINRGDYAKAESMMLEVVTARPTSAKAHYIYAEILAHNKHFDQAVEESNQAQKLDPALAFTQPDKFRSFQELLTREQAVARQSTQGSRQEREATTVARAQAPVERGGMPGWMWGLGGAAVALILWRMFGARRAAASPGFGAPVAASANPTYGNSGTGYGPTYGQPQAPTQGSGMLGTGLAVAGGLAAGVLAEKLFEGHRESGGGLFGPHQTDGRSPGLFGGNQPTDNQPAQELEDRSVDFGSGGDWGGDDGGGSSSGGDGGW
jgi:hypothetical protein